jgi:hypothetical protein
MLAEGWQPAGNPFVHTRAGCIRLARGKQARIRKTSDD